MKFIIFHVLYVPSLIQRYVHMLYKELPDHHLWLYIISVKAFVFFVNPRKVLHEENILQYGLFIYLHSFKLASAIYVQSLNYIYNWFYILSYGCSSIWERMSAWLYRWTCNANNLFLSQPQDFGVKDSWKLM